jgi:hypothetical protein
MILRAFARRVIPTPQITAHPSRSSTAMPYCACEDNERRARIAKLIAAHKTAWPSDLRVRHKARRDLGTRCAPGSWWHDVERVIDVERDLDRRHRNDVQN